LILFAVGDPLAKLCRLAAELFVRQRLDRRLEGIHVGDDRTKTLQFTIVLGPDDFGE